MKSQFCEKLRALWDKQQLYSLQVVSLLEIDIAQLGKIEIGWRQLKLEQIPLNTEKLKTSSD